MVRSLPRYSIAAWSELQQQGRERNNAILVQHRKDECMQNATCMTMAASGVNAPFVAHSVPSEEDRPTDRPTSVRSTERPRVPELQRRCQPVSQPAKLVSSSPLLSSPLSSILSLLVCFAEGCQAIENVILPTQQARSTTKTTYYVQLQYMDYEELSTTKESERTPDGLLSTETNTPTGR